MLAGVSGEEAQFLRGVFRHARKGRTWLTLNTAEVSQIIGQPRDRIVAVLGHLEEKGDLVLQVAGVRQGYRRLHVPGDMDAFVGTLNARFQQRESNDIGRVERVMQLAQHDGCLTQRLLAYFGEKRQACGHCCRCLGVAPAVLVAVDRVSFSAKDEARVRDLISEGHESIVMPRQLARFLCGIRSPATSRAKLRRAINLFGAYAPKPFKSTLVFVGELVQD